MSTYKVQNSLGKEFEVDESKIHEAEKDGFLPVVTNGAQTHRVSFSDIDKAVADNYHPIVNEESILGMSKNGLIKGALQTLPTAGMVAGGLVGSVIGPLGSVGGAGLGAAAGKSLQNLGESALGENKTRKDIYLSPILEIPKGMMAEAGGQAIGAIPAFGKELYTGTENLIAKKFGSNMKYTPIANKEAVEKAGESLGLNIPKGVLTDNPTFQKLESGLSQSGSLPAKDIRNQYNEFQKGLEKASNKIADLKTPQSDFAIGSEIQKDLSQKINANREPVSKLYEVAVSDLKKIPVDKMVVNKEFGSLKRNPLFQTKDGIEMLNEYKNAALTQPELASLKEWRSAVGDSVAPGASPLESKRIDAVRNTITKIRDNSINNLKTQLPKSAHGEVDSLIDQITLADKAHASNLEDLNSVKSIIGNKEVHSPTTFLNKLSNTKESDLAQRASNLDVTTLRNMQKKFPTVFEKTKEAKINEMIQNATNPVSGFSDARFIKQYEGLDKEAKDMIFAPEIQKHIENLKTIRQAVPQKLGPSGTPEGLMTMDMFNPKRNALDYGIKKSLNIATNPEQDLELVVNHMANPKLINNPFSKSEIIKNPLKKQIVGKSQVVIKPMFGKTPTFVSDAVESIPKAADSDKPKGEDKWASDGLNKIIEHSSDEKDLARFNELKSQIVNNPKLKSLLVQASDLKPGTKAMDKIVEQIKKESMKIMALLLPNIRQKFFDVNGNVLAGGKVYSYLAGTSTPASTFTDQSESTPNANPTILDANGEANIWIGSSQYKIVLKDSSDVTLWTADNVAHIVDGSITSVKIADLSVTTAKILDSNVTTAKIADSAITTAKIPDNNITTVKILDSNVTVPKLSSSIEVVFKNTFDFLTGGAIQCIPQFPWTAPTKISDPNIPPTGAGIGADWSPNGEFLAIAHNTSPYLTVLQRMNDTLTKISNPATLPASNGTDCKWSPNGQYLAVSHFASPFVSIYFRSGNLLVKQGDPATLPPDTGECVSWSPNGEFLAVGHLASPYVTIYQYSGGGAFTKLSNPASLPTGYVTGISWSADGQFMACAHDITPFVTIYQRSGTTFTKLTNPATLPTGTGNKAEFSPSFEFLAVTHAVTPFVTIYQRSGTTFTKLTNPVSLPPDTPRGMSWSPNGEFLAIGHNTTPFLLVYQRSGTTFTKLSDPASLPPDTVTGVSFSPDNKYLSLGHFTTPYTTTYKTASTIGLNAVLYCKEVVDV